MREVSLTKGKVALIDDDDHALVASYRWHARLARGGTTYYAATTLGSRRVPRKVLYMHRLILPPRDGYQTDHRNRNGLDNRRENLRYATASQNIANSPRGHLSPYRGVSPTGTLHRPWKAKISLHGRTQYLGRFRTAEEAAAAYDRAALLHYGEFAITNFPPQVS